MRNAEAERVVREVWAVLQRDGIAGVLELAWPDARRRPHSAHGRRFESTDEYDDPVVAREAFIALHRAAGLPTRQG